MPDPGNLDETVSGVRDGEAPAIIFTDGCPGFGPCFSCGQTDELRFGCCFDCAMDGERRAAFDGVLTHLAKVPARLLKRDWFGARTRLAWAWERLTKTGDYAPGGEFDSQYFSPVPPSGPLTAQAADTSARNVPAREGQKQEPSSSRTNSGGTASPKSESGEGH